MITNVYLKRDVARTNRSIPQHMSGDEYAFAVQSGLLVFRSRKTGQTQSLPLTDVSLLDGCPAAAPGLTEKP